MVAPNSIFVVAIFWTLYYVDRELLFPMELDKYVPSYVNHISHTLVLLPVFIEAMLRYKNGNGDFLDYEKAKKGLYIYETLYYVG